MERAVFGHDRVQIVRVAPNIVVETKGYVAALVAHMGQAVGGDGDPVSGWACDDAGESTHHTHWPHTLLSAYNTQTIRRGRRVGTSASA